MRTALLAAAALLCSCDESSSGLQQRLIEVEAQRDVQTQKVAELQSRLNSVAEKPAAPPSGAAVNTATVNVASSSDHAALIATASGLGDELAKEMPGGRLEAFGLTQMVGFKLVKADGFTSVLVPFFSKGDDHWECGWSKDLIKAALEDAKTHAVIPPITPPPPPKPPDVADPNAPQITTRRTHRDPERS